MASKRELFKGDLERACPVPAGKIVAFVEHWTSDYPILSLVINKDYIDLGISLREHGPSGIVSGEGKEGEENTVTIAEVELSHERMSGSREF